MNDVWFLYGSLVVSLVIMRIPYVGRAFRVLNTLVHESGHALAAILMSGKVVRVELFADLSGTTHTVNSGKIASFVVGFTGYLFASAFAWFSCLLVHASMGRWLIVMLMAMALINLVLYVRNGFGMLWLAMFITGCGLVLSKAGIEWQQFFAIVLMVLLLADSVMSAIDLTVISFRTSKKAGDASLLSKITGIPAQLFALVFVAIALLATVDAILRFFPSLNGLF
ncbi:MAG TPA: hypothetical protein DCR43_02335 [Bacteroidales bacterium]|nr:MAG: hypothetical protein A2X11_07555 [Bacteroidetes bacterium GWE2_42_24]OFY29487.1 MAG: hypothetical protein A2X09_04045 [Bacteroidetes bacterium GWF2_43_11]PKP27273.1 MAG: hypothetical protein CVU06_02720 [Bacteroidetes bacterium HGW-Bacteroidetes-22]HAQ64687.1 hypothetical protein [Bacteroidales bacterium]HBZ67282.1 hypothetical protein [Bacteroidales bacterium]